LKDAVGVVVEYNPFHNGHMYHLQKIGELVPGAPVIGVMSGNWTQRGEPALMNKWARTASTLQAGVDIVIELPAVFALQSAEGFAAGAIRTLAASGVVSHVCFGSEAGNLKPLQELASFLLSETSTFRAELQAALKKGLSYPAALHYALKAAAGKKGLPGFSAATMDAVFNPNNILAVEYLKAISRFAAGITPLTVKRKGAAFHDRELKGSIASATAVRRAVLNEGLAAVRDVVPASTYRIMEEEIVAGRAPVTGASFETVALALLRRAGTANIKRAPDVTEGMEHRIKKASASPDLDTFISTLKTKRYTRTRLQRILCYLLLSFTKEEFQFFNRTGPQYLRVLGFTDRGQRLLGAIKEKGSLPIITGPAPFLKDKEVAVGAAAMLKHDILAADIYALGYPSPSQRKGGEDFRHTVVKHDHAGSSP